jgi:hypothetical protein
LDSGVSPAALRGTKIGVFVGVCNSGKRTTQADDLFRKQQSSCIFIFIIIYLWEMGKQPFLCRCSERDHQSKTFV